MWIGYLQWHFKTHGNTQPPEPVLRAFHNIREQDAVLAYDAKELVTDEQGEPVTRWDGKTMKKSPVTGEDVPDETARTPVYRYVNPRKAEWPKADYVVGNPPFIGNFKMREALGEGYTESLRRTYPEVSESVDLVMYWWHKAAESSGKGGLKRFGFIATNSLRQSFNRRVLQQHLDGGLAVSIIFAVPDHPWVDGNDGADVRISMTVAEAGTYLGTLQCVISETDKSAEETTVILNSRQGKIFADLTIGADVVSALSLGANNRLACPGVKLHGAGFIVTRAEAMRLGLAPSGGIETVLREYRNGKDLTQRTRDVMVIDLFGHSAQETQRLYPEAYQWVYERVKPEREASAGRTKDADQYAERWWIFGKPRADLRKAIAGLGRYIATTETAKHRFFIFLPECVLPDNSIVAIALADAFYLGVLSSRVHVIWALAAGGRLGVGNDPRYNKTRCFDPFPMPEPPKSVETQTRELAESLDAHRKRQQAVHPGLTITDMYNVLEKLRSAETLTEKDKRIHEQGLVSVLKQIHDDLDAAVAEAYGWPVDLSDDEILQRLVALNAERAEEERRGLIRWLRPEFQNPGGQATVQTDLNLPAGQTAGKKPGKKAAAIKTPWPKTLAEQARTLRSALLSRPKPVTAAELAKAFKGASEPKVAELLETLATLGQARPVEGGRYAA